MYLIHEIEYEEAIFLDNIMRSLGNEYYDYYIFSTNEAESFTEGYYYETALIDSEKWSLPKDLFSNSNNILIIGRPTEDGVPSILSFLHLKPRNMVLRPIVLAFYHQSDCTYKLAINQSENFAEIIGILSCVKRKFDNFMIEGVFNYQLDVLPKDYYHSFFFEEENKLDINALKSMLSKENLKRYSTDLETENHYSFRLRDSQKEMILIEEIDEYLEEM